MLCDRVICNVDNDPPERFAGKARDVFEIAWRDATRRAIRGWSEGGLSIGVLLPLGMALRHGDVILEMDSSVVVVHVTPCEVWVAEFCDAASLATAALELGNLHVPVQVAGGLELVTLPDGPTRGILDRHATTWRPEVRRFEPLRSTVTSGSVRLARNLQLINSRE
jgi:urease accessory protein UreE